MPDDVPSVPLHETRSRESRIRAAARRHAVSLASAVDWRVRFVEGSFAGGGMDRMPEVPDVWAAEKLAEERGETPGLCLVRLAALADPTSCGTYVEWLVRGWRSNGWRFEDTARVRDDLDLFDRRRVLIARGDPSAADISRYGGPVDLLPVIRPFRTLASGRVAESPGMLAEPHARILRDDALFHVVMPLTAEAAAFWGWESEWCITWGVPGSRQPKRSSAFASYAVHSRFLFVRRHRDGSLWAIQLRRDHDRATLWDADDRAHPDGMAELFSTDWSGLLEGAVLAEIERDVPVMGRIARMGTTARERQLGTMRRQKMPYDWSGATAEERMLGLRFWGGLHAHLPGITPEERAFVLRRRPALVLEMEDATEGERVLALETEPGQVAGDLMPLSPRERAALVGTSPTIAARLLHDLDPGERMALLAAGRHMPYASIALRLQPLRPAERLALLGMRPEMLGHLSDPTDEERALAQRTIDTQTRGMRGMQETRVIPMDGTTSVAPEEIDA